MPAIIVLPMRTMAVRVITNPALVWERPRSTSMEGRVKVWANWVKPVPQLTPMPTKRITPV